MHIVEVDRHLNIRFYSLKMNKKKKKKVEYRRSIWSDEFKDEFKDEF